MTWTKLGTEFAPEAAPLSDAAFRTHVEALLWSNQRLLDLTIPKRDLSRFAETENPDKAAAELVDAGWWEDQVHAWWIGCRFPHWQQDRVQVENRRKGWAERQRRSRRHKLGDHSLCLSDCPSRSESQRESPRESRRDPTTSRRDPVSVSESVSGNEEKLLPNYDEPANAPNETDDAWADNTWPQGNGEPPF